MKIRVERIPLMTDSIGIYFQRDSGGQPIFWHSLTRQEAEQLQADLRSAVGSRRKMP